MVAIVRRTDLSRIEQMDEKTRIEIEAAAFHGLVEHPQHRTDVQNIDLMILARISRRGG